MKGYALCIHAYIHSMVSDPMLLTPDISVRPCVCVCACVRACVRVRRRRRSLRNNGVIMPMRCVRDSLSYHTLHASPRFYTAPGCMWGACYYTTSGCMWEGLILCDDGCRGTSKTGSGLLLTALEHHDVRLVCRHCYHCHCRRVLDGLLGMDCIRFLFSFYILCAIIHAFRHGNTCIHPAIHPLGRVCYLITLMKMLM